MTICLAPQNPVRFGFEYNAEREKQLKPLCDAALERFPPVPPLLCCYVAASEDAELERQNGKYFRGFETSFPNRKLPTYLINFSYERFTNTTYKHLIYIRDSTCFDTTGFVLTFAHELQHVFQRCCHYKLWAANSILYHEMKDKLDRDSKLIPIDIPHEQEANIVSKRVAESICGPEAVRQFANEQVTHFNGLITGILDDPAEQERERWKFFRDADASAQFDLLDPTKRLIATYRANILEHHLDKTYGVDFAKEEWWKEPED